MPKKKNPEGRMRVTVRLTRTAYYKLIERAKSNNETISAATRRAVEFYIENIQREHDIAWQSPLEHRMQKLENRLAGLMAKLIRVCGQSLWFSTLPYTKGGLPNKPLPQEAFQILWNNSRQFASEWLKKAKIDEDLKKEEGV